MVSNSEIIAYLKTFNPAGTFIDKLKIRYRPLVCPFQELFAQVNDGDRVADVGCGSGQFALMLNRFAKPKSLFGIEISERLVANANQLFSDLNPPVEHKFSLYDGIQFPSEISLCNLVFLIDVLHHVPAESQQIFLNNLFKVMSPGSRLILKDIDGGSPLVVFNKIHDLVFAGEIGKERSLKSASGMAAKAGFGILGNFTKRTAVYPHYFLILEKPVQ